MALAAKFEKLNSVRRTGMVEGEKRFLKVVL